MVLELLKNDFGSQRLTVEEFDLEKRRSSEGIRCPKCAWRPGSSDRWSCDWTLPEAFFRSCGSSWNTFATRGQCPGCGHRWHWTSCLRCGGWSPHDDWYESDDEL